MANGINAPYGLNAYQNLSGNADITKIESFQIAPTCPNIFAGDPVVMAQWDIGTGALVGTPGTIMPLSALSAQAAAQAQIVGYLLSVEYITSNNIYTYEFPFWSNAAGASVQPNPNAQYPIVAKVNIDPNVMMQVQVSTSSADYNDVVFLNSWIDVNGSLAVGGANIANNIPAGYIPAQNPANGNPSQLNIGNSVYYLDGSTVTAALTNRTGNPQSNFKIMGVVNPTSVFNVGNQNISNAAFINNCVVGTNTPGANPPVHGMPFVNVYGKFNNHMYATGTPGAVTTGSASGLLTLVAGTIVSPVIPKLTANAVINLIRTTTTGGIDTQGALNYTIQNIGQEGSTFTIVSALDTDVSNVFWQLVSY